ncbi:mannose-ethanolamine phosphotransferase gpi13 [Ceratocystis pirilliformis]|uniref:Mannose-ethanolamine phosphotransferase gpi13 n=1 Tax=Ceratocystis pirilliformis TaxID=259994 RepID=A0ABR3Z5P1_9PEZI
MSPSGSRPNLSVDEYKAIAKKWTRAQKIKNRHDAKKGKLPDPCQTLTTPESEAQRAASELQKRALKAKKKSAYEKRWWWTASFWMWMMLVHSTGILLFTRGFLLTRLILDKSSECAVPPVAAPALGIGSWKNSGSVDGGCWHPKSFDKAVIILIDALRYDFTVPPSDSTPPQIYHNALTYLHESTVKAPENSFLRPFIADPPTTTLQRLKGLTTGTLPTFIDAGSNFAGTAIEEDNILAQLRKNGKRIAHLGDDTWLSLFPDHFETNISRAYDSFNVWDLHTVDNGVIEHIFPLLKDDQKGQWDVLIGHLLGVDHAGHRYGPEHIAMASKLRQMDKFIREITEKIDNDTLLVVMGDHGMDSKGDHGGESDDEVEAALWMYSKRPFFGRTKPELVYPPVNAKIRPVNQIDLVPTLSLLLGIPIPYNNLGGPIEEAFFHLKDKAWDNLATVSHITSAQIHRYQNSYYAARGLDQATSAGSPMSLWEKANAFDSRDVKKIVESFARFQSETLAVCKGLWARFDIPMMLTGIGVMAAGVLVLVTYASKDGDEDFAILENLDLEFAETGFEMSGIGGQEEEIAYKTLNKRLVITATTTGIPIGGLVFAASMVLGSFQWMYSLAAVCITSSLAVLIGLHKSSKSIFNIIPTNFWGWLSLTFALTQCFGFASNSYTIWEDSISLFMISTFGLCSAVTSLQIRSWKDRTVAVYHSFMFVLLARVASVSKLCREEQIPYCTSTYYSSASSSTSSVWQLAIPIIVVLVLPMIIKSFLLPSRSYEGFAPIWVNIFFRCCLVMSALHWVIDAANNGNWFPNLPEGSLKSASVYIAQITLALIFVSGTTAFTWAPPSVAVVPAREKSQGNKFIILGYGNANGARYLLLPLNVIGACILLSKPVGVGSLAIMLWQVLSLIEILDLNFLASETIGPVMLAILGNFHFFTTGHQATLSSIQWDAAFIPLMDVRYPWSPLFIVLNTFAGQITAVTVVPLVVLWKVGPKRRGVLESVSVALASFVAFYAIEALATMAWAGYLRRHLMLYRIFSPRFMMAAAVLLVVDFATILVALIGTRCNTMSIGDAFGWAD